MSQFSIDSSSKYTWFQNVRCTFDTGTNYRVEKQRNFNGQGTAVYDKVIRVNDPNYTEWLNPDIYHL